MKAKRIVSFCSLFSLVLILSVYYVLSPITFTQDMNVNSSVESDDVIVDIVDGESAYFDNLNVLKQNAFLEEIKELEAIVASSNTSSEEKIAALEVKNEKIKMNEKEKQLSLMIKEKGYSNVYVEYEDKKVNILVSKDGASKVDALDIMRTVYSSIGVGYTPSVMFKS
jgi:hypothetical protein